MQRFVTGNQAEHDYMLHYGKLAQLEKNIKANGFSETGISYGIAYACESSSAKEMLLIADRRMYDNKTSKQKTRATHADAWDAAPNMV